MTDPYNATSYYNDALQGVNTRSDSANGFYGSLTSGAIRNQVSQTPQAQPTGQTQTPGKSSSNPYGEILNYLKPQQQPDPAPQAMAQTSMSVATPAVSAASFAPPSPYDTPEEQQRLQRQQWYRENIVGGGLNPNDANNFPGGQLFDRYGNFIGAASASPSPTGQPPAPPTASLVPTETPITIKHEAYNPWASWMSHNLYDQANVNVPDPPMGTRKVFPNGNVGAWDGAGWLHVDANGQYGGW